MCSGDMTLIKMGGFKCHMNNIYRWSLMLYNGKGTNWTLLCQMPKPPQMSSMLT
uniref:Uncharacterized protein n=1 Tax=Anguilla anguilla TaxID=7936 RepID=A0A0E9XPY1_ANGAN